MWDGLPEDCRKLGRAEIAKARALQPPTDREQRYIHAMAPIFQRRRRAGRPGHRDMLLVDGRPAEALVQYRTSLTNRPNRFNGLYHAGQPAEQAGDAATARSFYAQRLTPWAVRMGIASMVYNTVSQSLLNPGVTLTGPFALFRWGVLFLSASFPVVSLSAGSAQTVVPPTEPAVAKALEAIKANEPHFVDEQIRICEIAAPPFHEDKRAAEMARLFTAAGLKDVRIDKVGNVLGERPGAEPHPHLVVAAHMDTVFPLETDVTVRREGNKLIGHGIGDDCRGLAAMLAMIRAMDEAGIRTRGSLTFVANVGEEGLGDLRGTRELFGTTLKGQIDDFISIEPGEPNRVTNGGVGSYRYKVTFNGPGGHSYGAFGIANPIHALGRAVAKIADMQVPTTPKTTFNVGRIGGGTSVNAIPFEAWFEYDERSPDTTSLDAVDAKFKAAVQAGLEEENARWKGKGKLSVKMESLGIRPAGHTDPNAPIVQTAEASIKALGFGVPELGAGSSDSNIPMHLGIPAITLGGGGKGYGAHSLEESYDVTDSYKGVQNALLIAVSLLR